jgi:hypothetical protein
MEGESPTLDNSEGGESVVEENRNVIDNQPEVDMKNKHWEESSQGTDSTSSIFELQSASSQTSTGVKDIMEAGTSILIDLLSEDNVIISCCTNALGDARFRPNRVQNKLRRLLKQCAVMLKKDESVAYYDRQILHPFLKHVSRNVSYQLCKVLEGGGDASTLRLDSSPDGRDHLRKVEWYFMKLQSRVGMSDHSVPNNGDDSESDSDSEDDEDEDDMLQVECPTLDHVRRVLVNCEAYQKLRNDLFLFVYPSFHDRVMKLVAKFRNPRQAGIPSSHYYDWSRILTEMRCVVPEKILFTNPQQFDLLNTCKGAAEGWTKVKWDWWPLKPYMRPLSEHERRLFWTCVRITYWHSRS